MSKADEFVNIAASQIGYKESPANSNNTKYGSWYGMNYQPWCDMFVSWCANQLGQLDVVGKYAYCPYHVNYFKSKGWWLDREAKPQPGDVIFFANKGTACHVGIVERRNSSTSVTTIEGNTSVSSNDNGGAVMRRERGYGSVGSSWYILGFGRPQFREDKPEPPAAPPVARKIRTVDFSESDNAQKFFIRNELKDGNIIGIRNVSNYQWLSDPNSSQNSGAPAELWNGTDGNTDPRDPQWFIVEGTARPGVFRLHPKVAPHLAMDTDGGNTGIGTKIQFYTSNGTTAQDFYFYNIKDNMYRIFSCSGFKPIAASY